MGGYAPPPLPIIPSNAGQPRAVGMLAQGGHSSTWDPSASINAFMTNYLTMKEQVKQQNRQRFLEGVQMASQGIPVDNEKLMKMAKKGGLDFLPTEAPVAPPSPPPQQQSPQGGGQPGGWTSLPGGGSASIPNVQSSISYDNVPAQAPAQAPQQPGFWNRLGQGLGVVSPQVSNASPMGKWLSDLSEAGRQGGGMVGQLGRAGALQELMDHMAKVGLDVKGMSYQQEMNTFNMLKTATTGPPGPEQDTARENLTRMGVFKEGLPIDEFTSAMRRIDPTMSPEDVDRGAASAYMYGKMGGLQRSLAMMDLAKNYAQFMPGNDLKMSMQYINDIFTKGGSSIQPQWSPEQVEKMMTSTKTLMEAYPTAPANIVQAVVHAEQSGNQPLQDQLMGVLSKFPRNGTVEYQKHLQTLGYDYAALAQKTTNEAGLLNLGVATQLSKNDQNAFDNYWKLYTDPNSNGDFRRGAFKALVGSINAPTKLTIDYNGQKIPLAPGDVQYMQNWRPGAFGMGGPSPYLTPNGMDSKELSGFMGMAASMGLIEPKGPAQSLNQQMASSSNPLKVIQDYASQLGSAPDAAGKVQAVQSITIALSRVPPPARQAVMNNAKVPPELQQVINKALSTMPGPSIAGEIDPNQLPPAGTQGPPAAAPSTQQRMQNILQTPAPAQPPAQPNKVQELLKQLLEALRDKP